ncbi:hypothetical protein [Polyangium jinanense]|uniref:Uncharacterized protein n=1 Tax=Polyangium jinanense TaxID=2829994 RepID=A0A9X4ATY0_9BACT|nr:hypothetical protein [Polyangium jinanense]MDC3957240.1 hypothetical protein [Polyangium jinanense]MDC3982642.1 hypothetical protein [Polyangium jinanense]
MNRLLVFWIVVLVLMTPAHARAGTPYSVHWEMLQESNSCEDARLGIPGGDYFHANRMPLATFEVPGAYVSIPNGPKSNVAEAPSNSVLLRMGTNEFTFGTQNAMGNDTCVHQQNFVTLVSIPLGIQKPLFNVRRDGTAFSGSTQVGLSLSEINPPLARDIANLEVEIAAERKWLIENAAKAANLAERLDLLQQLDTELHDLVSRPLDEISEVDLDAILERYGDVVDEATREALVQLLSDLKKSVQDLKDELASLLEHFGAQADAVADLVTGEARAAGFSPDDPWEYSLTSSEVPWVEVPDVGDHFGDYAEVMQTLVHASSRIAIGFLPYAGPALDLCEAVTGKLLCLPGGEGSDHTTEERVGSAVGFGFGRDRERKRERKRERERQVESDCVPLRRLPPAPADPVTIM